MRILLTNDDGLRAPGLLALYNALADLPIRGHPRGRFDGPIRLGGTAPGGTGLQTGAPGGTGLQTGVSSSPQASRTGQQTPATPSHQTHTTILPIAPLTVQSATSHGVTFHTPLMTTEQSIREGVLGIAVDGRPADCVKLAISNLWPDRFGANPDGTPSRPDLLISGMNAGANCGINVIYSGTVAAAIEGAFLGIPSIAVSLHLGRGRPRFDAAAGFARRAIERLISAGLPSAHDCISINIPITEYPPDFKESDVMSAPGAPSPSGSGGAEMPPMPPMPPIKVCPMNTHGLVDKYERRIAPGGQIYYWSTGNGLDFHHTEPGSDVDELLRRCITVTPLSYDLTRHADLARWRERIL